ncbi:MAG: glycerol-3-phosphate 1-O-acyltransferase PlsY [Alphaproteobacteria bacterium]|nr:glycerol-3-phosphate 1-O-acyltransferase PlsY [Alphaproteobacteria bacterium]
MTTLQIALLITYFICAIPFGFILSRVFLKMDLRKMGSGGTGATNALRTGNKTVAAATLALDALKPIFSFGLGITLFPELAESFAFKSWLAIVAVFAHCYPVYLGFKGGKGAATAWGTMYLFSTFFALAVIGTWLAILTAFKKSSLAAMSTLPLAIIYAYLFSGAAVMYTYLMVALIVVIRHKDNIRRLLAGTEDKVKLKAKKK